MKQTRTPITRNDIEAEFRKIGGRLPGAEQSDTSRSTLVTGGIISLVVLLLLVFLLGKRKGKLKSTIVEIRRV